MRPVRRETAQIMSEENVELVRQALNAWIEVDEGLAHTGQLYEFFLPDATVDLSGVFELVGRRETRGLDEFLEFRAAWAEPYDDYSYSPEKILDAGANGVVVAYHQRGKPHGTDSWVEMDYGIVYAVEGGMITGAKVYATPEDALEATRLAEQAMPQSTPSSDFIRAGFAAFNQGDYESWITAFDENVEFLDLAETPDTGVFHGHAGARAWLAKLQEAWGEGFQFEPRRITRGDGVVVVDTRASGVGVAAGVPIEMTVHIVMRYRDRKVVWTQAFIDQADALQAAGLSE